MLSFFLLSYPGVFCYHNLSTNAHRPSLTFFFVRLRRVGLVFVLSGDLMRDDFFY